MFDNAYGCAGDAVSIRRNAFLAVFTSIELIFLNFRISKFLHQVFVLHLISPMKVKSCWSVQHNKSKYRFEKCQFNIGSYGTHSVLDTPDLRANSVVYVTVEFPIYIKQLFIICRLVYSAPMQMRSFASPFYFWRFFFRTSAKTKAMSTQQWRVMYLSSDVNLDRINWPTDIRTVR